MGVAGNQPPRKEYSDIDGFIDWIKWLSQTHKLPVAEVLRMVEVHERQRANNLARQDGDYRDEHIGGICDRLQSIADSLTEVAQALVTGRGSNPGSSGR